MSKPSNKRFRIHLFLISAVICLLLADIVILFNIFTKKPETSSPVSAPVLSLTPAPTGVSSPVQTPALSQTPVPTGTSSPVQTPALSQTAAPLYLRVPAAKALYADGLMVSDKYLYDTVFDTEIFSCVDTAVTTYAEYAPVLALLDSLYDRIYLLPYPLSEASLSYVDRTTLTPSVYAACVDFAYRAATTFSSCSLEELPLSSLRSFFPEDSEYLSELTESFPITKLPHTKPVYGSVKTESFCAYGDSLVYLSVSFDQTFLSRGETITLTPRYLMWLYCIDGSWYLLNISTEAS